MQDLIRLQKYIADCGVTSRRKAEGLIAIGKVKVNGKQVTQQGVKINPSKDAVTVEGHPIDLANKQNLYIVMNKPRAVVTTVSDPEGRKTVMDIVGDISERIYPVGRLDYLSEGLLILTNDGEFANQVMHPSHKVPKIYEVKIFGHLNQKILQALRKGVQTEIGFLKPESVRVIEQLHKKTWLEFRLQEGKNREIRRICEALELTIDKLRRVAIGDLNVANLPIGQYDLLSKQQLLKAIGFNKNGQYILESSNFVSAKKSVRINPKHTKNDEIASLEKFSRYRKSTYYSTLQKQAQNEAESAEKSRLERRRLGLKPGSAKRPTAVSTD